MTDPSNIFFDDCQFIGSSSGVYTFHNGIIS